MTQIGHVPDFEFDYAGKKKGKGSIDGVRGRAKQKLLDMRLTCKEGQFDINYYIRPSFSRL
jgi:hypothetical protein